MIRVATYNVHGFVGRDGRWDLPRVARVITDLGCHAIGLQEVETRGADGAVRELQERTGTRAVVGPTIVEADGAYGNVLLTTARVIETERHVLTVEGREPRGAVEARLETDAGAVFTIIVTHLGLRRRERRRQVERLLGICRRDRVRDPLVVAGDFNEWNPLARTLRRLRHELGRTDAVPTFPAWRPVVALDRIWIRPDGLGRSARAVATELTRVASDHLPVVSELDVATSRRPEPGTDL